MKIGRGENGGRSVSYTDVVIAERSLGLRNGGTHVIEVPADQLATPSADRHALIVRRGAGGAIIGSVVV